MAGWEVWCLVLSVVVVVRWGVTSGYEVKGRRRKTIAPRKLSLLSVLSTNGPSLLSTTHSACECASVRGVAGRTLKPLASSLQNEDRGATGSVLKPQQYPSNNHRRAVIVGLLNCWITTANIATHPSRSWAAPSRDDDVFGQIELDLKPPTADKPQIPLPTLKKLGSSDHLVEGMLYLKNKSVQPSMESTIYLTVEASTGQSQPPKRNEALLLAGAKIPVRNIRKWPIRFFMTTKNGLVEKSVLERSGQEDDWIVRAVICNDNDYTDRDSYKYCRPQIGAVGVAKLLKLPEETIIRAPVSLPLEIE